MKRRKAKSLPKTVAGPFQITSHNVSLLPWLDARSVIRPASSFHSPMSLCLQPFSISSLSDAVLRTRGSSSCLGRQLPPRSKCTGDDSAPVFPRRVTPDTFVWNWTVCVRLCARPNLDPLLNVRLISWDPFLCLTYLFFFSSNSRFAAMHFSKSNPVLKRISFPVVLQTKTKLHFNFLVIWKLDPGVLSLKILGNSLPWKHFKSL